MPPNSPTLTATMRAAHAGFAAQRADKFAEVPPVPATAGQTFSLSLRIRSGDSSGISQNDSFWTYVDGTLLFFFDVERGTFTTRNRDTSPKVLYFNAALTPGKPYVGSNAYGAAARVTVEKWRRDALAAVAIVEGEGSPYMRDQATPYKALGLEPPAVSKDSYIYEVKVSGPEAKKLVTNMRIVVEGTYTPLKGDKLTDCTSSYSGPRVDSPLEIYQDICWVGATITRIAYVDAATKEVLKEYVGTPVAVD